MGIELGGKEFTNWMGIVVENSVSSMALYQKGFSPYFLNFSYVLAHSCQPTNMPQDLTQ